MHICEVTILLIFSTHFFLQDSGPPALPDLTGLLGAVGSVLPGLLQLVQAKVALVNNILSNKVVQIKGLSCSGIPVAVKIVLQRPYIH